LIICVDRQVVSPGKENVKEDCCYFCWRVKYLVKFFCRNLVYYSR